MTLFWIVLSNTIIGIFSLVGVFTLALKEQVLQKILLYLVALSAGALMGGAFLHLLPESVEESGDVNVFLWVLVAFVIFFLIEKLLHWRHCHKSHCSIHTFGHMNLFGDAVHNFIDGVIIAASFVVSIPLGITTVFAIALHEIPQEIGDFGVLIYAGFGKKKALFLNFMVAMIAVLGGVFGYYLSTYAENSIKILLPFAAGGFIYIAASDLLPELRKEAGLKKSFISFAMFIIGILIMYGVKFIGGK
jgi:zinc and cadmium transporter